MMNFRPRGFSILELLVVTTVLALLLAVAGPGTASWVRTASTQNVAEAAQNGVRMARAEAIRRQRPVTLWLVTPGAPCALAATSPSWVISLDDPCAAAAPRIIETANVSLPSGMVFRAADADGDLASSLTFDSGGGAVGPDAIARIDISHPDKSVRALRVEVSASGAIRLCDIAVSSADPRACRT